MGILVPLRVQKGTFGSFWSSYMFVSTKNEFSMLENLYLDTKIALLGHLEADILRISENGVSGRLTPGD